MKHRGFVERIEHTTPTDQPFAVSIAEIEQVLEMVAKKRRELLANYPEIEDDSEK